MHYTMGNFVPWREPSWALLHERVALLAERAAEVAGEPAAPPAVGQVARRAAAIAERLAAEVPEELRAT